MDIVIEVISWLLLAAIFIVIEIISLGLTTIWFAGGAFVAAIAAIAGAGVPIQVILFGVVSVVLLIATRPIALKHLNNKTEKTNAEGLIGQNAMVLQTIDNLRETGQAKVNGMEWTARAKNNSDIIPADSMVKIVEIQGVKLIVEPVSETNTEQSTKEEEDTIIDENIIQRV